MKSLYVFILLALNIQVAAQDFSMKYPYQLKDGVYHSLQSFLENKPDIEFENLDEQSIESMRSYSKRPEYKEKAPKHGHEYNINNIQFAFPAGEAWGFVYKGTLYVFISKNKYAVITNLQTISSAVLRYYQHGFEANVYIRNKEFLSSYLVNMRNGELYQIRSKGDYEFLRNRLCRDLEVCVKKLKEKNLYDVLSEVNKKYPLVLKNHQKNDSRF